ncbi:hypothetical protein FIBSPDRAFT_454533 [Athelia psychrophila]|uniref:Uncharacterized protein n=1 Tax=Athelia psychrophila TaxID=1759441 RepID=A0A167UBZ3_9AGAM|nr:hypothetical protein FIBSPDRAFT_454533 [Fibularhizoctonia sp. CBS 109695]
MILTAHQLCHCRPHQAPQPICDDCRGIFYNFNLPNDISLRMITSVRPRAPVEASQGQTAPNTQRRASQESNFSNSAIDLRSRVCCLLLQIERLRSTSPYCRYHLAK